jgi:hypothetical protein
MNTNTTILLVAAAFGAIGFTLGRVTAPAPSIASAEVVKILKTGTGTGTGTEAGTGTGTGTGTGSQEVEVVVERVGEGDGVELIVEALAAEGFEGDTTIAIPGGAAVISRNGDHIEVSVEVTE